MRITKFKPIFILFFTNFLGAVFLSGNLNIEERQELEKCIGRMFINDNPPLIVDWTTKVACTSIWTTLLENYGLLEEARKISIHGYRIFAYQPKHKVTLDKFFDAKYCKVKFIRNPYKRAVSSYIHCMRKCMLGDDWNGSFEDFLFLLKGNVWQGFNPSGVNNVRFHTEKQYKISDKFIDFIIPIENCDLQKVNAITGLHLDISKYTFGHEIQYMKDYDKYVGNLPFVDSEKYPPYYRYYSPKTLRAVEELYRDDIVHYEYTVPSEIVVFIKNVFRSFK